MSHLLSVERECSTYWQLMPHDLKLEEIITANPPKFVYSLDFFVHLIHLTIEIPAKNKDLRRKDGYVPLNASILQRKNRKYHQHLEYLVENKILEVKPNYKPGVKSRLYRIAEVYLKDSLMEMMVSDKNLIKHLAKQYHLDFKVVRKYAYLQKWFNDGLQIDTEAAMAHCIQEIKQAPYAELYQVHQQAYGKMFMIKMIHHKRYWFTVDEFGYRLHTNLTNLSKDLRPFVKYNGQSLVSIDIKNSQPYISLKLLASKFPEIKQEKKEQQHNTHIQTYNTPIPIMLVKVPESGSAIDVQKYADLVVSGGLYEYMETEMRKAFGDEYFEQPYVFDLDKLETVKNDISPRDRVKKVMFQVFFSKNSTNPKEKKLFAKLFPNVIRVFNEYKGNKRVSIAERHKQLAKELQRKEASIMLDKVAREISRLNPDIPIYTIHDSIVTTEENKEFVQQVMEKVIIESIGFAPTLKPEYWGEEHTEMSQAA